MKFKFIIHKYNQISSWVHMLDSCADDHVTDTSQSIFIACNMLQIIIIIIIISSSSFLGKISLNTEFDYIKFVCLWYTARPNFTCLAPVVHQLSPPNQKLNTEFVQPQCSFTYSEKTVFTLHCVLSWTIVIISF
jgi:hypothetical protein